MAVMLVFGRIGDGNDAAMGDFADCVFKLNRSVIDVEVAGQSLLDVAQNALAH